MAFTQKNITLMRAIAMVLVCICLVLLFVAWIGESERLYGVRITLGFNAFQTGVGGNYTSFWSVMLIISAILFILLAGLAIFGLVTERNILVLPVALVALVMFFLALFQLIFIDSGLHLQIGLYFFLLCGLGAYAAALLDDLGAGRKPFDLSRIGFSSKPKAPKAPRYAPQVAAGWQCPSCGAFQGAGQNFCDRCGTRKPEPPRCPGCGRPVQPGEMFCANCGTKV